MSARAVNLDTYNLSLLTAKEDILNPRSSTNWALFAYDGVTNKLRLADSGAGGVAELAGKFHISKPQYGLCKLESAETGGPRFAMIIWVGQNVDDYRRTECASHIQAIKKFFKESHVFISAEKVEDVTEEAIRAELSKISAHASSQWVRRSSRSADKDEIVGTNYRKTNAAMEMRLINRESFWARAEREEEERKEEERRRAAEERRRLERERILKDRRDAEERDRKMNEKLQKIEEQRRKQAEQEEELRRQEKLKWEQQQREHHDDMRARLRRSESIEKAAEAAALVSQRTMNPREFFRQLSSSSSLSPTSPGSSRTGKPFRRYQRSLTDSAFIFSKAEESAASSPHSPPFISPFSRAPHSPFYHSTSPPASPDFRPVTSPAISPIHSALAVSALPSVSQTDYQVQAVVEPKAPSPIEPSAPPASPTLLVSIPSTLVKNDSFQAHSEALPASPPNTPTHPVYSAFCFETDLHPQAPTAPLPERPQPNADLSIDAHVHTGLILDTSYIAQAVLVEEDEEEDVEELEEHKTGTQAQPLAVITESVQTEEEEWEQQEKEKVKEDDKEEEEAGLKQETDPASPEVTLEEIQEEEEAGLRQETVSASPEEPVKEVHEEEEEGLIKEAVPASPENLVEEVHEEEEARLHQEAVLASLEEPVGVEQENVEGLKQEVECASLEEPVEEVKEEEEERLKQEAECASLEEPVEEVQEEEEERLKQEAECASLEEPVEEVHEEQEERSEQEAECASLEEPVEEVQEEQEERSEQEAECASLEEPVEEVQEEERSEQEAECASLEEPVEELHEEEEEGLKQETVPASLEEPLEEVHEEEEAALNQGAVLASLEEALVEVEEEEEAPEDREENDKSEDSQTPDEPAELSGEKESAVTEPIYQEMKHEATVPSTNGLTNGEETQEQNGIERSLSPSDTELSQQELAVCYSRHVTTEENDVIEDEDEDEEQEISENGQKVLAERQMCVRALYDYQAGDESEISFELGDIITDVETVDEAWWRGWSKDGRQGLFPAIYVETI